MPTRLETTPIIPPATELPTKPGISREALGLMFSSIWVAAYNRKRTKKPLSQSVGRWAASLLPKKVPSRMPSTMFLNMGQMTALFRWWAMKLETDVNMMVAREVPRARWCVCSPTMP